MIPRTILNALERHGVDSYTIATWKARLVARHYQAILQAAVIAGVLLLVLVFAGTAGAQNQSPAREQPGKPRAMGMKMGEMKQACEAKHEAAAHEVQTLAKTVTEARASADVTVMRAALDATLRHLEGMQATAKKCVGMMNADAPAAAEPSKDGAAHKH